MFAKSSNWFIIGAVAFALSACGGGSADQASGAVAAPLISAAAHADTQAAPPAIVAAAAPLASTPEVQLGYTAAVQSQPAAQAEAELVGMTVTRGSASLGNQQMQSASSAAQQASMAQFAAAEAARMQEAARWQAAMGNPDDEALLALFMYFENAERQAALSGVRYRKPSDPDCVSPRMMMCAND